MMRGSCGDVRAGACKHPSGWRPNFQSNTVTGVQRSLLKIIFVYEAQISQNGVIPGLSALTLVTFRHNSIVKVL